MSRWPRVVLVDHHDSYTWNLAHLLAAVTGELPVVVSHDTATAPEVLDFDAVVLSPGPGHPDDPRDFAVGREVVRAGTRPVLGVCLGMQGMVSACGGTVSRVRPAHGEVARVHHDEQGLFAGVATPLAVVRYHSLAATVVPECFAVTARAAAEGDDRRAAGETRPAGAGTGSLVMAVQHRTRPLLGVQFHPESVLTEHGERLLRNFLAAVPEGASADA